MISSQLGALNSNLGKTFQNIAHLKNEIRSGASLMSEQIEITRKAFGDASNDLIRTNNKTSKWQRMHSIVIIILTILLILVGSIQGRIMNKNSETMESQTTVMNKQVEAINRQSSSIQAQAAIMEKQTKIMTEQYNKGLPLGSAEKM